MEYVSAYVGVKIMVWTISNTACGTWFERGRSHIELMTLDGGVIISLWDNDVTDMITDGFLDPKDWHGSLVKYANHIAGNK